MIGVNARHRFSIRQGFAVSDGGLCSTRLQQVAWPRSIQFNARHLSCWKCSSGIAFGVVLYHVGGFIETRNVLFKSIV